jgi:hypothetical protein
MFRHDNKYNLPLLLEEIARTVIAAHQPNIHEKIQSEKRKKEERSLNR